MAVHYRDIEPEQSFLESMLSSGLQSYQKKREQGKQSQALGNLTGLSPEQQKEFANMSPEMQQFYVENLTKNKAIDQKSLNQQNQMNQVMNLLGLGGEQPTQQNIQDQGFNNESEQESGLNLNNMLGMVDQNQQPEEGQQQPSFDINSVLGMQQPEAAPQQPIINQPQQPEAQSTTKRYSDKQILATSLVNPNVGKAMQAQNDAVDKSVQAQNVLADKALERKAALNNKANESYFSSISAKAESLPRKQSALLAMTNALEGGDLGFFSRDNLAELTNVEGLRSAKGAEFISAGKDFFMGAIKDSGGRPNIFLEKKIGEMLPKVGRSNEANLTVTELLRTENNIQEKQIDLTYELANELESTLGYVPRDLSQRVSKQMKPFIDEQQELLENRVREITGEVKLNKVEKGTPINKDIAQKILAKANGDKEKARTIAKGLGYEF